jgi:hypothetical protein
MSAELLPLWSFPNHKDLNTVLCVSAQDQELTDEMSISVVQELTNEDTTEIDITKLSSDITATPEYHSRVELLRDALLSSQPDVIGRTATERAVGFAHRVASKLTKRNVDASFQHHAFPSDLYPPQLIDEYCWETSDQYLADRRPLANIIKTFISTVEDDQQLWPQTRLIAGFHLFSIDLWLQEEYIDRQVSAFATDLNNFYGPDAENK